jgi:hypothetical protein
MFPLPVPCPILMTYKRVLNFNRRDNTRTAESGDWASKVDKKFGEASGHSIDKSTLRGDSPFK